MARFDDAYSRVIAVVKVILPLVALALLSVLFLLARPAPVGEPLPYSDLALGALAREQRLSAPEYTTVTKDGTQLRLTANALTPDLSNPGSATGTDLLARVSQRNGYAFDVIAREGRFSDRTKRAEMTEGVRIVTSDGFVITSPSAWLRTDLSQFEAKGPIVADGPIGRLRAGALSIAATPGTGTNAVVRFHGGVNLLYQPSESAQVELP